MIPLRLRLKNFMSYAELDLDLRGVHTAVLTGANGAGKSTLLDAITYAIWDKARSSADQLIRLGQPEMWVELVFAVDDRVYRVWRRRVTKKGTATQVELHQATSVEASFQDDADYVTLTGTSVRETQARLVQLVRMDYETFTNSAFILQGRADQFTTKTPRERKALLGEILGLQHYDALAQAARDRQKAAQQRAADLEAEQAELRARLAERAAVEASLGAAREGLATLALMLDQATGRQARLAAEEAGLRAAEAELSRAQGERATADAGVRAAEAALAERQGAIAEATARVAARGEIEAAYAAWQAAQAEEAAARKKADAWLAAERALAAAEAERRAAAHARELALAGSRQAREALTREQAALTGVAADRARIDAGVAALAEARAAEAALADTLAQDRELEQGQRTLEAELGAWRARVDAERREKAARQAAARKEAAARPKVEAELAAARAALAELDALADEQERVREQGLADRGERDKAEAALEHARGALAAIDAKLAQLAVTLEVHGVPGHAGAPVRRETHRATACPLCESPLTAADLAKIEAQYARERAELETKVGRLTARIEKLDEALAGQRGRFAELKAALKGREGHQRREGELTARLAAVVAAEADAEALTAELASAPVEPAAIAEGLARLAAERAALGVDPAAQAALRARLAEHAWAEAARWKLEEADARLAAIATEAAALDGAIAVAEAAQAGEGAAHEQAVAARRAEMAAIGHDAEAHEALRARLDALADAPDRWGRLQQDLLGLEGARAEAAGLEADRARHALAAAEADRAAEAARRQLERLPDWEREAAGVEAELRRLREEERGRHEEVGRLEAALAALTADAERLATREAAWKAAVDDVQAYKELTQAFGKEGIQALIIENALPELEEEANRLLARISDNRMHVRLATQREKKTGGVAETLEIYISDEVGTRNYELYSGGEAFRVNFALRLALSRLLARRAGARLATLVIDEGFGTQDERGRERLVEAINAVSGEFERILVITHIRELKDAFNTQIEVTKRGGVSEVRLTA